MQLLEKIAYYFQTDEDTREEADRVGFLQVRLAQGKERQRTKKQVKKDGDKNLRFKDCSPEIRQAWENPDASGGTNGCNSTQPW